MNEFPSVSTQPPLFEAGTATPAVTPAPVTKPFEQQPPEEQPQTGQTVFSHDEIAAMHQTQAQLEIDRREQQRAAEEAELAGFD